MEAYWQSVVRTGGGDAIGQRYAVMLSTRGCPHVCNFCTSPLQSGYRAYRKRELESVIEEVRWLIDTYGVDEIQFVEDNFFVSKKRVKDLLKILASEFPDTVFWNTGGVEVNALDEEMIDLMAAANFHRAILAIESGDPDMQEAAVDKKVKLDRLPKIVSYLQEKNIDLKALYMIGFPGETRAQVERTVEFALNLGVLDFNLSIVQPLPGTPLYDECLSKGLFIEGTTVNNLNFGKSNIRLPDLTPEELEDIRRSVWRQAYDKRMVLEQQKTYREQAGLSGDVAHAYQTLEEYETTGFSIRPPTREAPDVGAQAS
jgi:anaerobic magnesium-protoporphyrin IX monomethyl ester cyclase